MSGPHPFTPGQMFGLWTVVAESKTVRAGRARRVWQCKCACGTVREMEPYALTCGQSTQCRNCGNREKAAARPRLTHGGSETRLFTIWMLMRRRCSNPQNPDFPHYGGRGITVCAKWMTFEPFRDWAINNGYEASLTIDRINNDAGYSPENCRWATRAAQNRNRRDNIRYSWKGRSLLLSEIAESEGVCLTMLRQRVQRRHWPLLEAVTLPTGTHLKGARR